MPGYQIPEPYKWDETFRVFYESLDEEHRGLFNGIFDCCEDRGNKTKLDNLYTKVKAHFDHEEEMMKTAEYPSYTAHKDLHDKFLKNLENLTVPLDDKMVNFAKEWLVDHIKDNDFGYKGKL